MSAYNFSIYDIKFDQKTIIERCEFAVETGRVAAFIGPSGCGKTTLLNTIAGLLSFDHIEPIDSLRADNLSYIFQEPRLIPWLTVKQNLTLVNPNLSDNQCQELLDRVDLKEIADSFPNQLSGGMQKRVSIARAFAKPPSLLLLDEPFSSLDEPTVKSLHIYLLALLNQYKTAAVLVTHDLAEAIALADDIYFLSSQPMNIIYHYPLTMTQSTRTDDVIQSILTSLHSTKPDLLKGKS